MKRLMNFLRGMVTLTVTGPFPERLINLCAQEEIDFWGVVWLDMNTLRLTTRRRTLGFLENLAQRAGCQVRVEGRKGLPDFLLRFRKRHAFLVGLTLSLCAVAVMSRFVLTIEVTGNEQVPTAVILTQLRQLGIKPGVYGPSIDRQQAAQEALLELKELSWMGINLHGTRLEVIVRERIPAPQRVDETGYYDIVAEADGIITQVEAEQGDAVVQEGDTVLAGETLISGRVTMEPPQYSDQPTRYYQTHARGRVWARTWRTLTAAIPAKTEVKEYAGEDRTVWAVEWMGRRYVLWGCPEAGAGWEQSSVAWQGSLPGGAVLPLVLERETQRAYTLRTVEMDLEAAQDMLEKKLLDRLEQLVGEDGTIVSVAYSARFAEGQLQVTVLAECREEIGKEIPGSTSLNSAAH